MDELGLPRAAVAGNSLGGAVALVAAARHPERVSRLVLVDSAGYNFDPHDRPALLRFMGSPALAPIIGVFPVRRELMEMGLRQVMHDDTYVTPERVDEYVAPLLRPGALAAWHALLTGGRMAAFPHVVSEVRVPTLVVWGDQDAWIPVAHASNFGRDIKGAQVVILPGCGHVPQEECTPALLDRMQPFLAGP
jgi:pimeloyl-ACP methyl ester carboxylesterase